MEQKRGEKKTKVSDVWRNLDRIDKIILLYFYSVFVFQTFFLISVAFFVFGPSSMSENMKNIVVVLWNPKNIAVLESPILMLSITGLVFVMAVFVLRKFEKYLNKKISRRKFKWEVGIKK